MKIRCVVACVNSTGKPDFFGVVITCTRNVMKAGGHYDKAKRKATDCDCEGPMVVYDEGDGPAWLFEHVFGTSAAVIPPVAGTPTNQSKRDGSEPGTVTHRDVSIVSMVAGNEKTIHRVIWNDKVMDWVGIGWVGIRDATDADRATYPTVVG